MNNNNKKRNIVLSILATNAMLGKSYYNENKIVEMSSNSGWDCYILFRKNIVLKRMNPSPLPISID